MLEVDEQLELLTAELKKHSWFEFVYITSPLAFIDLHTDYSQRLEAR